VEKGNGTTADPVIKVEGLTVRYGDNTVLDGVDFEVYPGEIFVIMGGSGCGKSTLLKHVIGIEFTHDYLDRAAADLDAGQNFALALCHTLCCGPACRNMEVRSSHH